MDDKDFSPGVISNRRTAIAVHKRLKDAKSPMLTMGRFYCDMLDRGIWDTLRAMAREFEVSKTHIGRTIAAARLPNEVLALFRDRTLAFRNVESLTVLVQQFGEAEVIKRASAIPNGAPIDDIFAILTTGKKAPRQGVRVSIAADARYLRVDVPNIALLAPHVKEIEEILNAMYGNARLKS
jgi:hypothetical protein